MHEDLSAVCLTDHDLYHGIEEFQAEAKKYDLKTIPAMEVSAHWQNRSYVHLLAYGIDFPGKELLLKESLRKNWEAHDAEYDEIMERLAVRYSVNFSRETIFRQQGELPRVARGGAGDGGGRGDETAARTLIIEVAIEHVELDSETEREVEFTSHTHDVAVGMGEVLEVRVSRGAHEIRERHSSLQAGGKGLRQGSGGPEEEQCERSNDLWRSHTRRVNDSPR